MTKFRPLLAEKIDFSKIRYPLLASPKYDGFRCLIDSMGNPVSRNMKNIANNYVFGKLKEMNLPRFDGELLTYTGDKVDDFNTVQSKLSTRSGMPDFKFMVFDNYTMPTAPFTSRLYDVMHWIGGRNVPRLEYVEHTLINNDEKLLEYENLCLVEGWEGVMVRDPEGPYKFGRSTVNEGILLKLKRFFDAEAVIIEAHELLHNANEATTNELGYTERSSHKANMQGLDSLGKYTVRWVGQDIEFDVGTGFTQQQRDMYWSEPDKMIGRTITFKYQGVGPNGKPRFPVFLGFRSDT